MASAPRSLHGLGLLLPWGFPGGARGEEPACRCRRQETQVRSLGRKDSPGGGHSNPLQYSCLENPMDRRAWWATVLDVAQSWTLLKQLGTHACILILEWAKFIALSPFHRDHMSVLCICVSIPALEIG